MLDAFVDTSGWGAWADASEALHDLAVLTVDDVWNCGGRLVTTNWVLAELTALLTSPMRMPKPQQIQLLQDIRSDPGVLVVTIDPAAEADAWNLWQSRPDKDWTLVDCASFLTMNQRQIMEAVTADRHFEQAGFIRLLK